uniref:Gamma-glutamyltranspeptidase 1-like n=1 Tax=Crassostrea virginica TaxID=6565 RepID=A0A8B8DHU9_CRAVI|nr:gamma-glutamyltranspeptidase 1-like [Crassostrea virginica]
MEDDRQDQINTNEADITHLIAKDKTVLGKGGHVLSDGLKKEETSPLHREKNISSGKDVAHSRGLKIIIGSSVIFAAVITLALILFIYLGKPQVGASGAVASDVGTCSDLGLAVLERGGNAVDATVTTLLCAGLVNPHKSGIGGGGFMMVYDHKTMKSEVVDFWETAPAAANIELFKGKKNLVQKGIYSVGIPGELKGLEVAHQKYGKLSWSSLVDPVVVLARDGFHVTKSMDDMFRSGKVLITDLPLNLQKYFVKDGSFLKMGMKVKRPDVADILQEISEKGSSALYNGKYTKEISDVLRSADTHWMTEIDLNLYDVKHRDIVQTTYHDTTVMTVPAPGAGLSVLHTLNMLEGYSLKQNEPKTVHRMVEAFKFSTAYQQLLGDPDFNKEKVDNVTKTMLDKSVATKHRNMTTNMTHSDPAFYGGLGLTLAGSAEEGASHVSIVDAQELMVSVTSSLNSWFGSGIMTKSGIILNNQMASFQLPDSSGQTLSKQLNYIAPGKRPLSSMAPTIVVNTKVSCARRLNLGATDGDCIPSAVVQTALNIISYNMNLTQAVQAPRLCSSLNPDKVLYEENFSKESVDSLTASGHTLVKSTVPLDYVQGVKKVKDKVEAYSDKRDGGRAAQF